MGNNFYHALCIVSGHGTATGCEWEGTYIVRLPCCFNLLFGETHRGNLWVGVDNVRHYVVVHLGFVAGDNLDNHHALF